MNILNKAILSLFLFFSLCVMSQGIEKEDLIGSWSVIKIENAPKLDRFKPLIEGFREATFFLNSDNTFKIQTKKNTQLFSMVTQMTNNALWIFNPEKRILKIGTKKDGFSTMGINVIEKGNNTYFLLQETGVYLLMKKEE